MANEDRTRAAIAGYVRDRLRSEERDHGRGYQATMARRSGLSSAHIANLITQEHRGVGMDAAEKLARAWGVTFEQLTAASTEWAAKHLPPPPSSRPPKMPNLEGALDFMRARGKASEEIEQRARAVAAYLRTDLSESTWIALIHDLSAPAQPTKN